jgi:hypothetical protein
MVGMLKLLSVTRNYASSTIISTLERDVTIDTLWRVSLACENKVICRRTTTCSEYLCY